VVLAAALYPTVHIRGNEAFKALVLVVESQW